MSGMLILFNANQDIPKGEGGPVANYIETKV